MLGTLADYKALIGQDPATEGVSDATVAQDGAQAVRTLPATVPYQRPGERGDDDGRQRHSPRSALSADAWPIPCAPSLRAGPASRLVGAGV